MNDMYMCVWHLKLKQPLGDEKAVTCAPYAGTIIHRGAWIRILFKDITLWHGLSPQETGRK